MTHKNGSAVPIFINIWKLELCWRITKAVHEKQQTTCEWCSLWLSVPSNIVSSYKDTRTISWPFSGWIWL